MKSVSIQYFALLRDQSGKDQENLTVDCQTYGDLYAHLQDKYKFTLPAKMIQVAVDDEFSQLHHEVTDGAHVVFIPPVAGG
jgi:molybdopterin synthase sulfur carrier subunit